MFGSMLFIKAKCLATCCSHAANCLRTPAEQIAKKVATRRKRGGSTENAHGGGENVDFFLSGEKFAAKTLQIPICW